MRYREPLSPAQAFDARRQRLAVRDVDEIEDHLAFARVAHEGLAHAPPVLPHHQDIRLADHALDIGAQQRADMRKVLLDEPPVRAEQGGRSWATRQARARLLKVGVANVAAFLQGKPENVVS